MHTLIVLYPTPDDPAAFKRYYEGEHIPLAAQLPGIRSIRFGYGEALGPEAPPQFCVFEAEFDSREAMQEAMTSALGQQVAADVPNYSPKGAVVFHYASRSVGRE
ncbi:MAG TPA: EthD family reductase [Xanthobacteraceae bacterium]|nr:EthD family reductase [Xanthobacteraceae bacterium]